MEILEEMKRKKDIMEKFISSLKARNFTDLLKNRKKISQKDLEAVFKQKPRYHKAMDGSASPMKSIISIDGFFSKGNNVELLPDEIASMNDQEDEEYYVMHDYSSRFDKYLCFFLNNQGEVIEDIIYEDYLLSNSELLVQFVPEKTEVVVVCLTPPENMEKLRNFLLKKESFEYETKFLSMGTDISWVIFT